MPYASTRGSDLLTRALPNNDVSPVSPVRVYSFTQQPGQNYTRCLHHRNRLRPRLTSRDRQTLWPHMSRRPRQLLPRGSVELPRRPRRTRPRTRSRSTSGQLHHEALRIRNETHRPEKNDIGHHRRSHGHVQQRHPSRAADTAQIRSITRFRVEGLVTESA